MIRRGYGDQAQKVQNLFYEGKRDEAYAAIPDAYIDDMGLYGPMDRIKQRFARYKNIFTGLTIHPGDKNDSLDSVEILEAIAELAKD